MQRSLAALGITAMFVWVGAAAPPQSGGGSLLYLGTADGITVVDSVTGDKTFSHPDALPAGDWSQVVTTRNLGGERTMAQAVEPSTGATLRAQDLDGVLDVRAVSRDGGLVALMPREKGHTYGEGRYQPARRRTTTIVITSLDGTPERTIEVDANVEPEAFSNDGSALFVIQYSPPMHPDRYRVARLDLATGDLGSVFTDQKELQGNMRGTAYAQTLAPDGGALYTFYKKHDGEAFVHVLNLEQQFANCVDLPEGFGEDPAAVAITTTPSGDQIVVVDGARRSVVDIDAGSLRSVRTKTFKGVQASRDPVVAVGDADLFIATPDALVRLDRTTLATEQRWSIRGIADVHVDPAGNLLVAERNRVTALEPHSATRMWSIDVDVGEIRSLWSTVPGTAKGTVDCAC